MESIASDPELGQEVIQLLHKKLQQRRQELEELRRPPSPELALVDSTTIRSENETLRSELAALELQLSTALEGRNSRTRSRNSTSFDSEKAVHEAIDDLQRREATQDETIIELKRKLDKYKEKHEWQKSENETLNNTLKRVTEDLTAGIDKLDCLQKNICGAETELKAVDTEATDFDWKTFQNDAHVPTPKDVPKNKSLKPFVSSAAFSHLPRDMMKEYGHLKLLIVRPHEFQWSTKSTNRGLHILPSFTYNPTTRSGEGGWIKNPNAAQFRSKKKGHTQWEVICWRQNNWYYYGTYQCVGCCPIAAGDKEFSKMIAKDLMKKVVLHGEQVAPVVHSFISALCEDGPLMLDLRGFERTGFNHSFSKALHSHKKVFQQMSSKPKNTTKKRPEGGQGDSGPPRKKQKKAS